MFVKSTHYDVNLPTSIDRLKARSIKLPYKKVENSKERVLLIFDNAHRSDSQKNTLASGIIGDFLRMVDAKCKTNTGSSIFTQSVFTINYSYAYEDQGSAETADTEHDDNSGDIEKVVEKINNQRVLKFIAGIKPTKIVVLGRKSFLFLRQFYTDQYLHQVAWASMMGVPKPVEINGHDCKLIAMLNPNIICQYTTSREPYLIGYFCRSWENVVLGKLRFDAGIRPELVKVVFIDTIKKFDKLLALLYSQKEVAIDTETTSLFRVANTMLTIQFAFDKKKAFFLPYKHYDTPFSAQELSYIKEKLSEYFLTNTNSLHLYCNANFDIPIIRKEFELPIYQNTIWDVQAGEYVIDENHVELANVTGSGYYNLGNLSLQYGFDGYLSGKFGKEDRVGIGKIPLDTPGLLKYGGYDVVILHGLKEQQLAKAKADKHEKYFNVVTRLVGDTIQMFSTMNVNGILVDQDYLWGLSSVTSPINSEVSKMETSLLTSPEIKKAETEIGKINKVPTNTLFGASVVRSTFSLRKRIHLQTLFFKIMKLKPVNEGADGLPALDKEFQEEYRDNPIVSAYTNLNKAKKIRDSFVKSLIKIISKNEDAKLTGRIRSYYKYLQVVTGRTSSTEPNLQQIPSHGKLAGYIKRAFVAGPGTIFIKVDYCVVGSTLLASEKGLIRIDSLNSANLSLPMASIAGKNTAINWVYQGKKDTVDVISEYGHKITATPDHKIYILRDNKFIYEEAQKLVPTDYLCLPKQKCTAAAPLNLTCDSVDLPTTMTPDLAFVIGAMTDRNTKNQNLEFLGLVDQKLKGIFGPSFVSDQNIVVDVDDKNPTYTLNIQKNLKKWFDKIGVADNRIPWSILQAPEECQLAFCSALLKNKTITATSYRLISQLQILLQSHGIVSKIQNKNNLFKLLLPLECSNEFFARLTPYLSFDLANQKEYTNFEVKSDSNYYFVKVDNVSEGVPQKVYDITMQDQSRHAFSANGILVSNCAHEVRGLALVGNDKVLASSFQKGLDLYDEYLKHPTPENLRRFSEEGDIHIINACFFFGLKASEVTKIIRQSVKAVVFGLIYGRSAASIAGALGRPVEEVEVIMQKFFNRFKAGAGWLKDTVKFGRKNAYVEAPSGLRRHLWPYLLPETKLTERNLQSVLAACDRRANNCIVGSSLIATDYGLVPISFLVGKQFKVQTVSGKYVDSGLCVAKGKKAVLNVTTKSGFNICGTPDHEVLVLRDKLHLKWIAIQDLKLGDTLCVKQNYADAPVPNFPPLLKTFKKSRLTPALSRCLGYLIAEGSYGEYGCYRHSFTNSNVEVINDFLTSWDKVNTLPFRHASINANGTSIYILNSKQVATDMSVLGADIELQYKRYTPDIILAADNKNKAAYLSALFEGDGYVGTKQVGIELSSLQLLRETQLLLLQFGIFSKIYKKREAGPGHILGVVCNFRDSWQLHIVGSSVDLFKKHIGFRSTHKNNRLAEISDGKRRFESISSQIPGLDALLVLAKAKLNKYSSTYKGIKINLGGSAPDRKKIENKKFEESIKLMVGKKAAARVERIRNFNLRFETITDIHDSGVQHVYDICVPEKEHFIANGLVIHNSPIQGLGSGIGYSAARHLEEATFARFKKWSMKNKKLPIRNQNMVHDSMEHEVEYSHIGYALEMIQHSLTNGVQEKCMTTFGMKFPVGLSIDMDIGGALDNVEKWDGSIENLHVRIEETLVFQRDVMKYDVDVKKILTKIFTGYLPEFLLEQAKNGYFTKAKDYGMLVDSKAAKINRAELNRQQLQIKIAKEEKEKAAAATTTGK